MPPASASEREVADRGQVPAPGPSASAMGSTRPIFIGRAMVAGQLARGQRLQIAAEAS